MYAKSFHVSTKDLRICANSPALEDFVIQITLRISTHVRKSVHVSINNMHIMREKIQQMIIIQSSNNPIVLRKNCRFKMRIC